jgi:pimeloyl-ACP methyl ester carboxylesterase
MAVVPDFTDVPVPGGSLRVARWGAGPRVVVAAHGLTASSMSWAAVARHLGSGWTVIAPDLRGRGDSRGVPGPFGITTHADDLAAVAAALGLAPVVLAGHSMGGFVVAAAAARHPALADRVVLVDGGLPLPPPPAGTDVDAALEAVVGPAIARLGMTFTSPDDYIDFWRGHPAFAPPWSEDVEPFLAYDLAETPDGLRPKPAEAAVRADGRDLLTAGEAMGENLRAITCPVVLVRAERGLFDEPGGFQPDVLVETWRTEVKDFADVLVEEVNHYSILIGDRGAAAVARRIADDGR